MQARRMPGCTATIRAWVLVIPDAAPRVRGAANISQGAGGSGRLEPAPAGHGLIDLVPIAADRRSGPGQCGDDRERNERRDQRIFDRGHTGLVLRQRFLSLWMLANEPRPGLAW